MGRLVKDPELTYTATNNTAVCKFTLAVDRRFSKEGSEKTADFIPIVAWRQTAEFCSKYFSKGQKVVVVGSIQVRHWTGRDDKEVYMTEVVTDEVYFAESKKTEYRKPNPADDPDNDEVSEATEPEDYLPF